MPETPSDITQLTEHYEATRTEIAQHVEALARLAGLAKKQSTLLESKTRRAAALRAQIDLLLQRKPEAATLPKTK